MIWNPSEQKELQNCIKTNTIDCLPEKKLMFEVKHAVLAETTDELEFISS